MAIEYRGKNKARLTVYVGLDSDGKKITARKTITYIDKRDAKRQYEAFVMEVRDGIANVGGNISVHKLCDEVIESMKRKGKKATTIQGYETCAKRIKKTLPDQKARGITAHDVDKYIDELAIKYGPKTVRNTIFFLSACYNQAIKWKMLSLNPFEKADLPAMVKHEKNVLKADELQPFISALRLCENRDLAAAASIALFCGLRRSELLGLTEDDVDLNASTITVNKSRHHVDGESVIQSTKTASSARIVAMPKMLTEELRALIRSHKEKSLANPMYQRNNYVIRNNMGLPYAPARITEHLARFERDNELPMVSLHGLRHTHASLVNYLGHDMAEISHQMGHSQLSTTMNIYTHLFTSASVASHNIAADIDDLLGYKGTFGELLEG